MVGVVKTGIKESDVLVLCDPFEEKVAEVFYIRTLTDDRQVVVSDSAGRLFSRDDGKLDMWVHPLVMLRFPAENMSVATKFGYKTKVELHVNDNHRIHSAHRLRNSELYQQLPAWARS
jgi:hypothetical protein